MFLHIVKYIPGLLLMFLCIYSNPSKKEKMKKLIDLMTSKNYYQNLLIHIFLCCFVTQIFNPKYRMTHIIYGLLDLPNSRLARLLAVTGSTYLWLFSARWFIFLIPPHKNSEVLINSLTLGWHRVIKKIVYQKI